MFYIVKITSNQAQIRISELYTIYPADMNYETL